MKRLFVTFAAILSVAGLAAAPGAQAQVFSAPAAADHFTAAQAASFSKQVENDLAARGATVAMVFRTGRSRDKLPEGIAYTHGAFWVYRDIPTDDGQVTHGYAVYNLYAGDGKTLPVTQSYLKQDWPFGFVQASAVDDVAIIVPSPEMQRRMLEIIDSPDYQRLHNPAYSLVANPLTPKRQNCNSFMLDIAAAAAWRTFDTDQIRTNLKAHFRPSVVKVGGLTRLLGPLFDKRLTTDDQTGPILTATYESMSVFMADNGLLEASYTLDFKP